MKDLEPILNVLCNYHSGYVLSEDELDILRAWLAESPKHQQVFDDLANGMKWVMGSYEGNVRELIQTRLIEIEEIGS
jgi:hypothetical protein